MLVGIVGLMGGDDETFRTLSGLRLELEVSKEVKKVAELLFCPELWSTFCGGEESRPKILRGPRGKFSTGPKVMVRC